MHCLLHACLERLGRFASHLLDVERLGMLVVQPQRIGIVSLIRSLRRGRTQVFKLAEMVFGAPVVFLDLRPGALLAVVHQIHAHASRDKQQRHRIVAHLLAHIGRELAELTLRDAHDLVHDLPRR